MSSGRVHKAAFEQAARFIPWALAALLSLRMAQVTWLHARSAAGIDFAFFWDAGRHALRGNASAAYLAHASAFGMLDPIANPPPFLLFTAPLGLLDYGGALALWLAGTGAAYVIAARRRLALALTSPAASYNALFGQTGFLTSSVLLGGSTYLEARPVLGGALLGLMVIKPQLALLVPVALVAGGKWRSLVAAGLSAATLLGLAALAFEPSIYAAWWMPLQQYPRWLTDGVWPWNLLASPYALLRWFGAPHASAVAGQLAITLGAAWIVAESWRKQWTSKVAVLAAATMLASPYLFAYDAVILVAPLACLATGARWKLLAVWILMLVPLLATTFFGHLPLPLAHIPNTMPIAAALSLLFLWQGRTQDQSSLRMVSS